MLNSEAVSHLDSNRYRLGNVESMKSELRKEKKQRASQCVKEERPACGTIAYLAESRGSLQRAGTSWHPRSPNDVINGIVKKHPADK